MFTIPDGVKAISFDIWNTLLAGNKAFTRPRLQLMFNLLGYPSLDVEQLREAYQVADRHFDHEAEAAGRDFGLGDRLEIMYRQLGLPLNVPGEAALRNIQHQVALLRLQPEYMPSFIEPDLLGTLHALVGAGYTLGTLSNTGIDNEQVMLLVLEKLGLNAVLDITLFSCEDGRAKPNPELFQRMAKELGYEPHEVLHVGDNVNADYRAIEAGLHAVVYAPSGRDNDEVPYIRSMKELVGQ